MATGAGGTFLGEVTGKGTHVTILRDEAPMAVMVPLPRHLRRRQLLGRLQAAHC
ncbi:MAG TPA: hypothetical protein VFE45_05585 [Coriobacteriia bacterium]|nr:hypothetical protein [Coriobacteriia bacterium]